MKKTHIILASTLAVAMLASACSKTPVETSAMVQETNQAATTAQTTAAAAVSDAAAAPSENTTASAGAPVDLLSFCSNLAAGNCLTVRNADGGGRGNLNVYDDGSFLYVEYDYGEDGRPFYNAVSGTFTSVTQEGDHIYSLTVGPTNQDHPTGESWNETRTQDDANAIEQTYTAFDSDIIAENTVITVYENGVNKADVAPEFLTMFALNTSSSEASLPNQLTPSGAQSCVGMYIAATNTVID